MWCNHTLGRLQGTDDNLRVSPMSQDGLEEL